MRNIFPFKSNSRARLELISLSREIRRERNLSRRYLFRQLCPRQIDRGTENPG